MSLNPWKRIKQIKSKNISLNPQKRMQKIQSKNRNYKTTCPLYSPIHYINSCKVIQAQAKSTNTNWLSASGLGLDHIKFAVSKKRSVEGREIKTLIASSMAKALKIRRGSKSKTADYSDSEDKLDRLKQKNLEIVEEYD